MNHRVVARYVGIVVLIVGTSMLLSVPWGLPALGEVSSVEWTDVTALLGSMCIGVTAGALLLWQGRGEGPLLRKEALAIVGLSWIAASLLGALPLLLCGSCGPPHHWNSMVDAIFESASGFTGTGATIYGDLENPATLPRCILFWRQETHFLGGLGIMVLFVAVLGHGSPGKMLMQTEATGPMQQNVHARTQQAARTFAGIYMGMNVVLVALYLLQGMSVYDALGHS